jgi:Leucine-rich repeat (LRR) protein
MHKYIIDDNGILREEECYFDSLEPANYDKIHSVIMCLLCENKDIPQFEKLSNLETINLGQNELKNCDLKEINFCSIKKLKNINLEILSITMNKIKNFPDNFNELLELKELYCDCNDFKDFPVVLYKMKNLKILEIHDNEFKIINENIENMKFLSYLKYDKKIECA